MLLEKRDEPERALTFYRRGARKLVEASVRHLEMIDVLPPNERALAHLAQAVAYMERGAELGQLDLAFDLAWLSHHSFLVPLDQRAEAALRSAAADGHVLSRAYLALRADEGRLSPAEGDDLLSIFRRAAFARLNDVAAKQTWILLSPYKFGLPDFSSMTDEQIDVMSALRHAQSEHFLTRGQLDAWLAAQGKEGLREGVAEA